MSGSTPRPGAGSPNAGSPMVVGGPGRPRPGSGPGSGPPHMAMMMPTAKPVRFKESFRRLIGELRPERPLIVVVLLLGVVSVFLAILGPRLLGEATNVIFAGVVGQQLPAGFTVQQSVDALNATGDTNQAQMLANMPGVVPGQGIDFTALARILSIAIGVYVFDDSFSALDFRTDARLRAALGRELGDATVIIVAQRVGTILHADRIVVLDEGEVAGIGTHDELMRTCETYREIVLSQVTEEEVA